MCQRRSRHSHASGGETVAADGGALRTVQVDRASSRHVCECVIQYLNSNGLLKPDAIVLQMVVRYIDIRSGYEYPSSCGVLDIISAHSQVCRPRPYEVESVVDRMERVVEHRCVVHIEGRNPVAAERVRQIVVVYRTVVRVVEPDLIITARDVVGGDGHVR